MDTTGIIYCLRKKRNSRRCHVFKGNRYMDDSCSYLQKSLCGKMQFNERGSSFGMKEQEINIKDEIMVYGKCCSDCLSQLSLAPPVTIN